MSVPEPKIYILPNLMTAGNLFCGFMAVLTIIQGIHFAPEDIETANVLYQRSIFFILGACLFDLLDGRLARIGGKESPFGREFDSLADVVSFGVAPALLIYNAVLIETPQIGAILAFLYLLCGTMRLARFNCMAVEFERLPAPDREAAGKAFVGLPIPMAAGTTASLTIFMTWLTEGDYSPDRWKYFLVALMLVLSLLMMSHIPYPSFKKVNLRSRASLPILFLMIIIGVLAVRYYQWMLALLFTLYILYGFVRPWISSQWRKGIESPFEEDEDEDEDEEEGGEQATVAGKGDKSGP